MSRFNVKEILDATGGRLISGSASGPPARLNIDSRTIEPGDVFVALRGVHHDGHAFVDDAVKRGARGAIVSRASLASRSAPWRRSGTLLIGVEDTLNALQNLSAYHRRRYDIPLIAISGSNGKTTTTQMSGAVLKRRYRVLQTKGNLNNHIGVPLTLLRLTKRHQVAVLEMGINHRGELTRLCEIAKPTVGVITNVSRAHLAGLKRVDLVARAKGELLQALPPDGVAILNADDPFFPVLKMMSRGRVVTFGFSGRADVQAACVHQEGGAWRFHVRVGGRRPFAAVRLTAYGKHNVANAAAASAVGVVMGLTGLMVAEGLASFKPLPMRSELIHMKNICLLNDTYNANPASVRSALMTLTGMTGHGRRIAVLGDMAELGSLADSAHRDIGALAAELGVDRLVACGTMGGHIASGALKAGMPRDRVMVMECKPNTTYEPAVNFLTGILAPGDIVLVKGSRAMRMEHIVDQLKQRTRTTTVRR